MKLIIQLFVLGICGAIYFFYIGPTGSEVKTLMSEKNQYNEVLDGFTKLIKSRDNNNDIFLTINQSNIDRLNKLIPDEFNAVLFANELSFLASKYGMLVKDLKVNESKTDSRDAIINQEEVKPYKITVATFKVSGSYTQFKRFLNDLESSLRIIDVRSLSIKSIGGRNALDSVFDYSFEVTTYSLR
jgi:Tfp pilus assembly protein PilO